MPVLPLEPGIVYGPVFSRRLGMSLGVNLLPTRYKVCSFDCVYCHYGPTHTKSLQPPVSAMPWGQEVVQALEDALKQHPTVAYLTFSGNGEPTLHPAFAELAAAARDLRDRLAPGVKLALFSNSTTVNVPAVRHALRHFDAAMMKLDAGDPDTMAGINRPASGVATQEVVEGLSSIPGVIVQSVLIRGSVSNVEGAAYHRWVAALKAINPRRVYVYSTEYPVQDAGVVAVAPYELARIARDVEGRTGLQVHARWLAA